MQDNFVGYLLNSLDPDAQREVEEYLRTHPEALRQVDLLRQALEPLEADVDTIEPPPGLAVRTLACVAEYCCRDLPRAPARPRPGPEAPTLRWWRRADVLVAAGLLLCVTLLIPPVVGYLRGQHQLESCKNNLAQFGFALARYSDHHQGAFPDVADAKLPRNVAGMVVPILISEGQLPPDAVSVRCPGNGPPRRCPWDLEKLRQLSDKEFDELAPYLSCCYAYTLGFFDPVDGKVRGFTRFTRGQFPVPIMADQPPFRARNRVSPDNSPNHGGLGQNVLFTDGHVEYFTSRAFGGDDIYLNRHKEIAAGEDSEDIVLGPSEARPDPIRPPPRD